MTTRPAGPFRFDVSTPTGYAEMLLRGRVDRSRLGRRRAARVTDGHDAGASVVEWVIISALVVGMAVVVGAIFLTRVRGKVESIDFDTPGSGGGGAGGGGVP